MKTESLIVPFVPNQNTAPADLLALLFMNVELKITSS